MRTELLALALATVASCKCGSDSRSTYETDTRGPTERADKGAPRVVLAQKEFFRLEVPTQPACQVDAPCEARLVLTALGDYHVNDNYPFKLVADATPGVKVDGDGTFSPDGKTGTMAIPFRSTKSGTAKIAGTFKLSVCNDLNCQIETPKIAFDVPVR